MRRICLPLVIAALLQAAPANADPLPDAAVAERALLAHPLVQAAAAGARVADHRAAALRVGEHEFSVDGRWQQRRVDGGGAFGEWELGIARGLRLPAKARADKAAALALEHSGREALADAHHQAALLLHQRWFDALAARARRDALALAADGLAAETQSVRRRHALGDAAAIDLDRAEAASAAQAAELARAEGDWQLAAAALAQAFPGIELARMPDAGEPVLAPEELARLGAAIVEHSHERGLAQAQRDYALAHADRARAARVADPVIGLRTLNEVDGRETALGLSFSWAIGGKRRDAESAAAIADAERADSELAGVERALAELSAADVAAARAGVAVLAQARTALAAAERQAGRAERAHALGELDLAQRLLALRQLHEARANERAALIEAHRALARLRIDAHALWAAPAGADEHAAL
jgi:cobalt-zinc-cadmium efflux system outer membrane protein